MSEICWINAGPGIALAIVMRPRGDDWLEDELLRLKAGGIDTLVSMLESHESSELGLFDEHAKASKIGMKFVSFPVSDRSIPSDLSAFRHFAVNLAQVVLLGERVGIHCRASIGRASIAAAAILMHLGIEPKTALANIEIARGCHVPDTDVQREWLLRYKDRM